jgi:hypothetical protein
MSSSTEVRFTSAKESVKEIPGCFWSYAALFGRTHPLAMCRLVIGTGAYGRLPVMDDVKREAGKRGVKLIVLPTAEAIEVLQKGLRKTNAVLHVTC